jgi:hypothetical protein
VGASRLRVNNEWMYFFAALIRLIGLHGNIFTFTHFTCFCVELWNLISWAEGLRLGMFEMRMRKCVEQSKERLDKLHKEELYDVCCSQNIICAIK